MFEMKLTLFILVTFFLLTTSFRSRTIIKTHLHKGFKSSTMLHDINVATSSIHSLTNAFDYMSLTLITPLKVQIIPTDLSSTDSIIQASSSTLNLPLLLPNNEIKQLDGGFNLGIILWSIIIYMGGPFPSEYTFADRLLPSIVNILKSFSNSTNPSEGTADSVESMKQQENSGESSMTPNDGNGNDFQWYLDFVDGYSFRCPIYVDFIRFVIFGVAGYYFNYYLIESLGGDVYWGWATGLSTCFPTALIVLSRKARVTREFGLFEVKLIFI